MDKPTNTAALPTYIAELNIKVPYEPASYVGSLDWFNIALCARKRMREAIGTDRWERERDSFWRLCAIAIPPTFR